jgi:translation initiation factor IF-2
MPRPRPHRLTGSVPRLPTAPAVAVIGAAGLVTVAAASGTGGAVSVASAPSRARGEAGLPVPTPPLLPTPRVSLPVPTPTPGCVLGPICSTPVPTPVPPTVPPLPTLPPLHPPTAPPLNPPTVPPVGSACPPTCPGGGGNSQSPTASVIAGVGGGGSNPGGGGSSPGAAGNQPGASGRGGSAGVSPGSITSIAEPGVITLAQPAAVEPLTPVGGISFGQAPYLWPLFLLLDVIAAGAVVIAVRKSWSKTGVD